MTHTKSHISLSIEDATAQIRLNNTAKHNALTAVDIDSFIADLEEVENDSSLRVLVIAGSGDKTFCAGASLDQLSSGDMDGARFEQLTDKLASMTLPVIASLNGSVYGGGAEIGLCCDFRIGVRGMTLRVPAARLGLCYPLNGIQRYVQRLGPTTAKRILVASEEFDSDTLLALNYLTQLVEPDQLQNHTRRLAESISGFGPIAVRTMKQLCDQTAAGSLDKAEASATIARCNQSMDLQEGLRAYAEKRKPVFSGE